MNKLFITCACAFAPEVALLLFMAVQPATAQESDGDVGKTRWSCAGTTLHVTRWSYDTASPGEDSGGMDYIVRFEGPPPRRLRIRENAEANGVIEVWADGKPCKERKMPHRSGAKGR
jgi:hypothetical protein